MEDICTRLPCISLIPECDQSIRHLHISHYSHYIIHLGFPPGGGGGGGGWGGSWGVGGLGGELGEGATRCIMGDMQTVNCTPVYFT